MSPKKQTNMTIVMPDIDEKDIADFKDPFQKANVREIEFHISRRLFDHGEIEYKSTVRFANGNTRGYQNIEAESFPGLVRKTMTFVDSL